MNKHLTEEDQTELLKILKARFEKNPHRHRGISWKDVEARLKVQPAGLWSLKQMEDTGGEPDIVAFDQPGEYLVFCDCSAESPKGRRSLCYDRAALESRKEHKPKDSAEDMAAEMGIEILDEQQYFQLQRLDNFDAKTSSWLKTPVEVRDKGGAIFGDFRFGRVFVYHNGAESYYAARGFRGMLKV